MKFIAVWTLLPGTVQETVDQFLAGGGAPEEGVKLLGRWHKVDGSGGFSLFETDRPEQLYRGAAPWLDLLQFETYAVLEDAQVAPILADVFKK